MRDDTTRTARGGDAAPRDWSAAFAALPLERPDRDAWSDIARRLPARPRRVRRDERGMRQGARPFPPQADQVVAVGTIAVKEHDELFGLTTGRRG